MKKRFGDTTGYRLVIYPPDYASLTRPDPTEERRELNYTYRGGWDDPSTSSKTSDVAADLGKFDMKAVVGVLRGAPETLGINPADVTNTYLSIDPADDPTDPTALSIDIYVSNDYGSGSIELAADGSEKAIRYPRQLTAGVPAVVTLCSRRIYRGRYYGARCWTAVTDELGFQEEVPAMLELAILGGLLLESPMHGYELRKRLTGLLGAFRAFSYGSLYPPRCGGCRPTLIVEDAAPDGTPKMRRARRVYQLTEKGKQRFSELVADTGPQNFSDDGFGVHLAFFNRTPPAEARMRILEGASSSGRGTP